MNKNKTKGKFDKAPEELIILRLNAKTSKFEYIGGYAGCESKITIMCKDCGNVISLNAQIVKPCRKDKVIQCNCCNGLLKKFKAEETKEKTRQQREKEQKEKAREREQLKQIKYAESHKVVTCDECGRVFETKNKIQRYCSEQCRVRQGRRTNEHMRRRKEVGGRHDTNISLNALVTRDNNMCHICGKTCNIEDYVVKGDTFVAGNYYPSIDHVIPLAKGGTHTWDNVKLAHRICNSIKRDK